MRILIVDDEPGIRQVCQRALSQAGHDVSTCMSGEEAMARLSERWDMLVTDLSMPGDVDGNELIRRARAAGVADVAIMTAYPTVSSSIAALKDGACDYLLKPFSLAALLELVQRRRNSPGAECPPKVIPPRRLSTATILFADVRGFTTYSAGVPPEEAAARLDLMLACLIEAVHAEGGTTHKLIGDGVMALFGLPLPHENPVAGAARAALRGRAAVKRLGPLQFGYGINTGEVAAGGMGTKWHSEYDVIGSAVNLAARLEEAAAPGQVLLGPESAALLGDRFELGPPRALALDGFQERVAATELLSERTATA